ncbi:hypothetical protein CONLIGDRAFT_674539 [Coniochaeta ligniaria NRRL 30616]|uniref:Uncharacterized protein n=1 Tax=Coniochaeta ligniaria NRRL 30616 TaxID=1408157 RepID=A0A1J7J3I2_9PEZI|nr:hypothetical protein CONLIGDRAFT_674539 [Coniochaeta ligniaria NRRL 30616]
MAQQAQPGQQGAAFPLHGLNSYMKLLGDTRASAASAKQAMAVVRQRATTAGCLGYLKDGYVVKDAVDALADATHAIETDYQITASEVEDLHRALDEVDAKLKPAIEACGDVSALERRTREQLQGEKLPRHVWEAIDRLRAAHDAEADEELLADEVAESDSDVVPSSDVVERTQKSIARRRVRAAGPSSAAAELQRQLDTAKRELSDARAAVSARDTQIADLQADVEDARRRARDEADGLNRSNKQLVEQEHDLRAQVAGLEGDVELQQERIGELVAAADKDRQASGATVGTLREELARKDGEVSDLAAQIVQLQDLGGEARIERLQQELAEKQAEVRDRDAEVASMAARLQRHESEAAAHAKAAGTWESLEKLLHDQADRAIAERGTAERERDAARAGLARAAGERDDALQAAEKLEQRRAAAVQTMASSRVRLDSAEDRVKQLHTAAAKRELRLNKQERQIEDLQARLAGEAAAAKEARSRLQETRDEVAVLGQQAGESRQASDAELARLREEAATARRDLDACEARRAHDGEHMRQLQREGEESAHRLAEAGQQRTTLQGEVARLQQRLRAEVARSRARTRAMAEERRASHRRQERRVRDLARVQADAEGRAESLLRASCSRSAAMCQDLFGLEHSPTDWLSFARSLAAAQGRGASPEHHAVARWSVVAWAADEEDVACPLPDAALHHADLVAVGLRAAADGPHGASLARILPLMNCANGVLATADSVPGELMTQVLQDMAARVDVTRRDVRSVAVALAVMHAFGLLAGRFAVPHAAVLLGTLQRALPAYAQLFPLLSAMSPPASQAFVDRCREEGRLLGGGVVMAVVGGHVVLADCARSRMYVASKTCATQGATMGELCLRLADGRTHVVSYGSSNLEYLFENLW